MLRRCTACVRVVYGLCAALFLAAPAAAQDVGLAFDLYLADVEDRFGWETGIGIGADVGAITINAMGGGFFYPVPNELYYWDYGTGFCVERSTGYLVASNFCDNLEAEMYGRLEAILDLGTLGIGGGVRHSAQSTLPYGTISFRLTDSIHGRINAGTDYGAMGLVFRW